MPSFVIYARKSTESEDRQVLSIDAQINELTEYANKNGLEIMKVFSESKSAKKPGRPIFNTMVSFVRSKRPSGILCWKLDRLTRNLLDGAIVSELVESGAIGEIRTPHQTYRNNASDKFMTGLDFIMAKKYIDDLSENVKRGLKAKANSGWLPGRAPLGYLNTTQQLKGQRLLVKDPERFPLIRRMWDLLLTGRYSVPEIATIANKQWGFKRPGSLHTPPLPLSRSSLFFVFTSRFYAGSFTYGGEVYQGRHEPMVTVDEFERAQKLLWADTRSHTKRQLFEFTGLFHCGACGAAITAEEKYKLLRTTHSRKRYVYYHCTHHKVRSCRERSITDEELARQVDAYLSELVIPQSYVAWLLKYLEKAKQSEGKASQKIADNARLELEHIETKLSNLLALRISPDNTSGELISNSEYLKQKEALMAEKMRLERSMQASDHLAAEVLELTQATFNFALYAQMWFRHGDTEKRRTIISSLGSNREIINKNLRISTFIALPSVSRRSLRQASKTTMFEPPKLGQQYTQAAPGEDGFRANLRELNEVRTGIREILANPLKYSGEMTALENIRQLYRSTIGKPA